MRPGKLIALGIFAFLAYQNQVMVAKNLQHLMKVRPVIMTYMEIISFRGRLTTYSRNNEGSLPDDIGEWLNINFKSTQKDDMALDFFGEEYQVVYDGETSKDMLISCGPDKKCLTGDDIELKV